MGNGVYVNGQYVGGNGGGEYQYGVFGNPMMSNQNYRSNDVKK